MLKNGVLKRQLKEFNGDSFYFYHLSFDGNKLAQVCEGEKNFCFSRAYKKNNKEILHDALQFEAYRLFSDKVKAQGGHICSVITDKEQRSRNYKEAIQNLKKVGDYKNFSSLKKTDFKDYGDLEIIYAKSGQLYHHVIEIDRGYDANVVRSKSAAHPNMIWVTDNAKQSKKIADNAKTGYQAIWEVH